MAITIDSIQPVMIQVMSGGTSNVSVTVSSSQEEPRARLVFVNRQPAAAQLFDSNQRADVIQSNLQPIKVGTDNHLTHMVGFELEAATATGGAVIAIDISVEDGDGNQLSMPRTVFVLIAA